MHSNIAFTALLGVAAAAPAAWGPLGGSQWGSSHSSSTASAPSAAQTPFKFPLSNGFPNIKIPSQQLDAIELAAHGTLPNTPLPTHLSAADITSFQVIALGETFEVAYFTSLVANITAKVPGYEVGSDAVRNIVLTALNAVIAQEELHAIGANAILQSAGVAPVPACQYVFPVSNFDDAIALASQFTDLVLGTLQDVQAGLAANNDAELIPLIASIIGQEGEQNGYYRSLQGLIPSQLPFLTRSAGPFAFSALNQNFFVPKSCPFLPAIPVFGTLNLNTPSIAAKDQTLSFSFDKTTLPAGATYTSTDALSLVYINQQNLPVVEKLTDVVVKGNTVTFSAPFPYTANLMNGLTIAAVTNSAGPFADAPAVAKATLFGPALIEIN